MAGGGKVRIADGDNLGELARVVNGRLLVSSTGGGGGGGDVNITEIDGVSVAVTTPGVLPVSVLEVIAGDTASAVDDDLFPSGVIRDDVLSTLSVADGDYTQMRVSSVGALWVDVVGDVAISGGFIQDCGGESVDTALNMGATSKTPSATAALTSDIAACLKTDLQEHLLVSGFIRGFNDPANKVCDVNENSEALTIAESFEPDGLWPLMLYDENEPSVSNEREAVAFTCDGTRRLRVTAEVTELVEPFNIIDLSSSTNGRPIAVAATSSPGTTIHTAVGTDQVYLYASNINDTDVRKLTIQWGGTSTSDTQEITIGSGQKVPIALGEVIQGSLLIRAFADVASEVNITGYVVSR